MPTIVADVGDHSDAAEHIRAKYGDRDKIHAVQYKKSFESGGGLVRTVRSRPELFANEVFICCVDVLLDIDESEFLDFHRNKGGDISIALTTGSGVPNEGAYFVDSDGQVMYCAETNGSSVEDAPAGYTYRGSSTGAIIANVDFLRDTPWQLTDGPMSLYRDDRIIPRAIGSGSMFAFNNGDRYFTDVGTVASWANASENHTTIAPYIHYTS